MLVLLLSWHLILISVRKLEAMVGSGCPVPLKSREAFLYKLTANLPNVACTFRWSKTNANQRTFQTLFNCKKQVCKMRKGLASKYLEDWLLLFHQTSKGKKVRCLCYIITRSWNLSQAFIEIWMSAVPPAC